MPIECDIKQLLFADINECEPGHSYTLHCSGDHQVCSNTIGGAECICEAQYAFDKANSCKPIGNF